MELIRQVRHFNHERDQKIIIVFVCRAYDLENDNNIKSLFEKKSDVVENNWVIFRIQNFDESVVQKIIGEGYSLLSIKLKKLLQTPSNLYIWQHLDGKETYSDCVTASHLIGKWYQQICQKGVYVGVTEKTIIETENSIIDTLDKLGRLYVPRQSLRVETAGLDYLVSCEIILIQKEKVGFVHQSILDYYMSKRMTEKYYNGQNIEEIIGEKMKQTPSKRYQVQMFLQNILDYDTADFITVGEKILLSKNMRYYMKFTFYEILSQILEPDDIITQFIVDKCENELYGDYILDNVIFGRKQYVSILRKAGILEKWFADLVRKEVVFMLLQSISQVMDIEEIVFIREHAFKNEEDDRKFKRCFLYNFSVESDEIFELRMLFYKKYPDFSRDVRIDLKSMISQCEIRTIRLISFWLANKVNSKDKERFCYQTNLIKTDNSFTISDGETVIDALLPYFPMDNSREVQYSIWSGKFQYKCGIERCCVELVKKANVAIIAKKPDVFWKRYEPYMGKGYHVFNEIILSSLEYLPENFSNQVISYISSNIDENCFDYTSGTEDKLELVKRVIKAHGKNCDQETYLNLEKNICNYISPRAAYQYRNRIEENRRRRHEPVYWSFWGDLQWELLNCLPRERMSKETGNLLQVLSRRFAKNYYRESEQMGNVESPISGKSIGKRQWLQIITNKKLSKIRRIEWNEEKRGFVESSYSMYASNFNNAVRCNPEDMIRLVLKHKDTVLPAFIDSLFSGVAFSENINKVPIEVIERMFREFPCDLQTERNCYFCIIIENLGNIGWSLEVIRQLKEIALNYKGTETEDLSKVVSQSCSTLKEYALNCTRGHAISAISALLWKDAKLLKQFKDTIERLTDDKNPIIRFAALYALWPSYNIDRFWAEERIIRLYESDIRMTGHYDSRNMFFRLYPKYRERILKIIERCLESTDKDLIELGANVICEFYLRHHEFERIIFDATTKSKEQMRAILYTAVMYLDISDYRERAKDIILYYKEFDIDAGNPLSLIFDNTHINVECDKEFLQELMKSNLGHRVTDAFTFFLEENAVSVVDYADIIIGLCENVLQMDKVKLREEWGIENEISKLIMVLYDETSNSDRKSDKQIAEKCLDLWDIMFEKQLGCVREISYKLMDR